MEELKINDTVYSINIHQNDSSLPYLLMLHGFMGDVRVFEHLIDDLTEACNPITLDLLGHGKSEKPVEAERYCEKHQIDDLVTITQQLGLSPLFLYGYSMGGRLALKTALENPDFLKGLILESTTYGILDDDERAKRRQVDAQGAKEINQNYNAFLSKWEELALFQSPLATDEQLAGKYKNIHLSQDPKAMAASIIGFGTGSMEPVRNHFPGFHKPVMVLVGSCDQKYVEISRSLVSYFNNVHLCYIKAGHRIHLDNPGQLAQEINLFIHKNSFL